MTRCIVFFLRGLLWRWPVPYHRDYRCWSKGQDTAFVLILIGILIGWAVFGWLVGNALAGGISHEGNNR
jgi:hypothetical protein